jgi:hypothetical protein
MDWTEADLRQNEVIRSLEGQLPELRAEWAAYKQRMAKDQILARLEAIENVLTLKK